MSRREGPAGQRLTALAREEHEQDWSRREERTSIAFTYHIVVFENGITEARGYGNDRIANQSWWQAYGPRPVSVLLQIIGALDGPTHHGDTPTFTTTAREEALRSLAYSLLCDDFDIEPALRWARERCDLWNAALAEERLARS